MKLLNLCLCLLFTFVSADVYHDGGSCGTNSIPYKLEIDNEGKPGIQP